MDEIVNIPVSGPITGKQCVEYIRDNCTQLGWEVWVDQIDTSPHQYVIIKSQRHNNKRLPCYVRFRYQNGNGHNVMMVDLIVHADQSTMECYGYLNSGRIDYYHYRGSSICCRQGAENTISLCGNKEFFMVTNTTSSNSRTRRVLISVVDDLLCDSVGAFAEDVPDGASITVQLEEGDAANLRAGVLYRVVGPGGQIQKSTITSIDHEHDKITLGSLIYPTGSGTCIGVMPFNWFILGTDSNLSSDGYGPYGIPLNYDSYSTDVFNGYSLIRLHRGTVNDETLINLYNNGEKFLKPFVFFEEDWGTIGQSSYIKWTDGTNDGELYCINEIDSGSVSSSTSTVITDSNKNWIVDSLKGLCFMPADGDHAESFRRIVSNTQDTLTVSSGYSPTISGSVGYLISEAVYAMSPEVGGRRFAMRVL